MKELKINKISINALLLLVDIPLLLLLSKNLYVDTIYIYINIRLIMVCLIPLILILKLLKTTIIIFKKYGLFSKVSSLVTKKSILGTTHIYKDFLDLLMFYIECIVLMILFIYSLEKAKLILLSSNNLAIFLTIISLNIVLVLISKYINKRCDTILNSYEEKKNMAV
ncbi:hypothetical protein [Terrisporobacter mayombei]|uniref:DUF2975 domain-containing protein n=1 Tax=Terrisporobacter mayombei TaxID=1541 RepID=A0ABY9PY76_9FIRM|nr:hypothetical protein [Terrisporobacter mayombei]MCC3868169.1 hypothetical protein [Terrisporobacter mayombei]WMT80309.1 hypothetical protein TEMA_06240 [Terrisporobacter mayombei]